MNSSAPVSPGNFGIENRKLGMLLFLAAEAMFFTGLIGAYIVLKHSAASWPDISSLPDRTRGIYNTGILLVSCGVLAVSASQFKKGVTRQGMTLLLITAFSGLYFLMMQLLDYRALILIKKILPSSNLLAASYFTMTGFHALHVLAGVLWMAFQAGKGAEHISPAGLQTFSLYWYFTAGVSAVLFALLYF